MNRIKPKTWRALFTSILEKDKKIEKGSLLTWKFFYTFAGYWEVSWFCKGCYVEISYECKMESHGVCPYCGYSESTSITTLVTLNGSKRFVYSSHWWLSMLGFGKWEYAITKDNGTTIYRGT